MDTEKYFSKICELNCDGILPDAEVFFSPARIEMVPQISILKSILNHVKAKLNDFQQTEWSEHTKNRNPAHLIKNHLKYQIRAEFVTQAFCKFFECVSAFPMVEDVESVFQSVHLCEAPGAFVSALNHYLKQHHPDVEFKWRASTLNPYYEGNSIGHTILDDRLISHTLNNWIFGDDYDGDILKERNVRSFIDHCSSLDKISLVTSDGSIDCNDAPDRQEEIVAPLHYAEFVTSLAILADGGSMLIKMFTFYELSSLGLLYVLSCCFKSLRAFKPTTSKEGNSECYVIALGYKKSAMPEDVLEKLICNLTLQSKYPMLALSNIPESFTVQVHKMARQFMLWQVAVIENNIRTYQIYDRHEFATLRWLRNQMIEDYVNRYRIVQIRSDQKLCYGAKFVNDLNLNVKGHQGSYTERKCYLSRPRAEQLTTLYDGLKVFFDDVCESNMNTTCLPLTLSINCEPADFIKLIRGKTVERVLSSKFMLAKIVKFFTEVQAFAGEAPQPYEGNRWTVEKNKFKVETEYFKSSETYEAFEKDITKHLLTFILETDHQEILIDGLPLFTQFLVGVTFFLSLFVFTDLHLKRSSGVISLKTLRPDGKEKLKVLVEALESNPEASKSILGITDTQRLFSHSHGFFRAVIDYNNSLCLKFCSFYLNISNRLL